MPDAYNVHGNAPASVEKQTLCIHASSVAACALLRHKELSLRSILRPKYGSLDQYTHARATANSPDLGSQTDASRLPSTRERRNVARNMQEARSTELWGLIRWPGIDIIVVHAAALIWSLYGQPTMHENTMYPDRC